MFSSRLLWTLFVIALLWSVRLPDAAAAEPAATATRYKSVLVAGDGRLPVFDNAVRDVAKRLRASGGSAASDMQRLSSAAPTIAHGGVRLASLDNVLGAIAAMRPAAGQGCLVFATSHGGQDRGLWLQATDEFLTPRDLDRALTKGCGDAPTVVVISACFSGVFAEPPMARPNRVVLTAARPDRTSFGCGAGRVYTAYDKCLLDALDAGGTWPRAYAAIQSCVVAEEQRNDATPSEPQAWFGRAVANLELPGRTRGMQP